MREDDRTSTLSDSGETGSSLEQWRVRVSRLSVAVLLIALGVFLTGTALEVSTPLQFALAVGLAAAVGWWLWLLRQGRCPRCAGRVRLQQRLTLPPHCPGCGLKLP
jgi:hypothetical protein